MNLSEVNARVDAIIEKSKRAQIEQENESAEAMEQIVDICLNSLEQRVSTFCYTYVEIPDDIFRKTHLSDFLICQKLNEIFDGKISVNYSMDNNRLELHLRINHGAS